RRCATCPPVCLTADREVSSRDRDQLSYTHEHQRRCAPTCTSHATARRIPMTWSNLASPAAPLGRSQR
ncbi:hypothetical protein KUCAC02_011596, partial [Chaenocephalus aceratus]